MKKPKLASIPIFDIEEYVANHNVKSTSPLHVIRHDKKYMTVEGGKEVLHIWPLERKIRYGGTGRLIRVQNNIGTFLDKYFDEKSPYNTSAEKATELDKIRKEFYLVLLEKFEGKLLSPNEHELKKFFNAAFNKGREFERNNPKNK